MSAYKWTVNPNSLKTLPRFFPLEKSSIFIEASNASKISQQIAKFLINASMQCVFHDDIALAEATTDENVQFTIRMFLGRVPYSHGIILEVKRCSGSPIKFQHYCNLIFDLALEKDIHEFPSWQNKRHSKIIGSKEEEISPHLIDFGDVPYVQSTQAIQSALFNVKNMLESVNYDSIKLGLERLVFMTDLTKVNISDALFVSKAIIFRQKGNSDGTLSQRVFQILNQMAESQDLEWCEFDLRKDLGQLSLIILRNSLSIISNSSKAMQIKQNDYPWLVYSKKASNRYCGENYRDRCYGGLISMLINLLKNAECWPRCAALSVTCLVALCQISNEATEQACNQNVISLVEAAERVGTNQYLPLSDSARDALLYFGFGITRV